MLQGLKTFDTLNFSITYTTLYVWVPFLDSTPQLFSHLGKTSLTSESFSFTQICHLQEASCCLLLKVPGLPFPVFRKFQPLTQCKKPLPQSSCQMCSEHNKIPISNPFTQYKQPLASVVRVEKAHSHLFMRYKAPPAFKQHHP